MKNGAKAFDDATKQKITVLLAEYNTLRTEVTVFMAAVGIGFSKAFEVAPWAPGIIIVVAVWFFIRTFNWNEGNTRAYTRRLRVIERDINRCCGEKLLMWESEQGWGSLVIDARLYKYDPPPIPWLILRWLLLRLLIISPIAAIILAITPEPALGAVF
jgi:hypothetical protein